MKNNYILFGIFTLTALSNELQAQYDFPECASQWHQAEYLQDDQVSHNGANYMAKYWTASEPGTDGSWLMTGLCGEDAVGPDYDGPVRSIGYLPTWIADFDAAHFDPSVVTHINVSFLMFQQNNNDFLSSDFASIAFHAGEQDKVDSMLFETGLLDRAHQRGVTVSVALGGATDFAFVWLMTQYADDDAKMDEIATLITNYVNTNNLDGVDLDLECWWPDPAIAGTTEQGGRVRGDKWGGTDAGPHPAGAGLTQLAKKLREKMPNKLISAAVFGTSYYGNNYDDDVANYLDWLGLMTYDFTGSWTASPFGPHSNLYRTPESTYPRQNANQPIYSAVDALEYWMGTAEPAWNHDGGFNVPKAKLVIGVPLYGYDFSERKPNNGNGYLFVPYKDIVAQYPNAATTYDALDPQGTQGHITADGRDLYYETPMGAAEKIDYVKDFGHQGIIIWELTQDAPYSSESSVLQSINDALGREVLVTNAETSEASFELAVYPNPAQHRLVLSGLSSASPVVIINLTGEEVLRTKATSTRERIDITGLTEGVYFVQVNTHKGISTSRFIKQ